ncbi:hypothetical protein EYF80_031612 [Liparis tanakae]|uniref:Uncharacterized protein n=1 Tax=Liparis tanakae TaxID=230148 RepID=A0A4Z2GXJ5_9TELE|nr:hypothetical protein EYF80_031612 [Liparis tanakae]
MTLLASDVEASTRGVSVHCDITVGVATDRLNSPLFFYLHEAFAVSEGLPFKTGRRRYHELKSPKLLLPLDFLGAAGTPLVDGPLSSSATGRFLDEERKKTGI